MRKIYLVLVLTAFVSFTFAQRNISGATKMNKTGMISVSKTPTDTLFPPSILDAGFSPTLYGSQGGGYVCGTNGYGDVAKANAFIVSSPYKVEGCAFWVGAKEIVSTPGNLMVKVLKCDGPGTAASGAVTNAPKTELSSVTISMTDVDTADFNFVTFPSPVTVSADYAISFDFSGIGNDTVGLVTSTADANTGVAPGAMELCWDKWSDGTWHTLLEPGNWSMDLDIFVAVIADMSSGLVDGNYFIDGIKLDQNMPNPAVGNSIIRYEIQNSGDVTLDIYDMTGKKVLSYDEGKQAAGKHSIAIDSDKLMSGTYFYTLKAGAHRLAKKMTVN